MKSCICIKSLELYKIQLICLQIYNLVSLRNKTFVDKYYKELFMNHKNFMKLHV